MNAASESPGALSVRLYGGPGSKVVVLHGGPGAAGYMAPVCRELSDSFTVVEPLQRESGHIPLTVARHVLDLLEVVRRYCPDGATLIGHSWGAMLALAFAAEYPRIVRSLVLVGCGTFDAASRSILEATVASRMSPSTRDRLRRNVRTIAEPDVCMCVEARILEPIYSYRSIPHPDETEWYDARGRRETWDDMLVLQRSGVYPGAFSSIEAPVLMLHGSHDPHPGPSILDSLRKVMPQVEYIELPWCGHYPWWEELERDAFFAVTREWLACHGG